MIATKKNLNNKIFVLGLIAMDELLLHRNVSKATEITIEDASILSDMIVHVGPHAIFTFSEKDITDYYQNMWTLKRVKIK